MPSTVKDIRAGRTMVRTLVVSSSAADDSPVLLFLHGKGESSPYEHELPKVCFYLSPPYRAAEGSLRGVVVVAPQAPHNPDDGWNWRSYAAPIGRFLADNYRGRDVFATGFSRGGLGVLQVLRAHPNLIRRWAIVDPQCPMDAAEQAALIEAVSANPKGWLRYGNAIEKNTPFSKAVAAALPHENSHFVDIGHGDLALAAFKGKVLQDSLCLYDFLGLDFEAPEVN
jgi:pimeloyl-ACP methyl ester carboxylesterase